MNLQQRQNTAIILSHQLLRGFRRLQRSQQRGWAAGRLRVKPWKTQILSYGCSSKENLFTEHRHTFRRQSVRDCIFWDRKSLLCQPCTGNFSRQAYIKDCKHSITEETLRDTRTKCSDIYPWKQTAQSVFCMWTLSISTIIGWVFNATTRNNIVQDSPIWVHIGWDSQ